MKMKNYMALLIALFLFTAGCTVERNLKLDARLSIPPAFKQMPFRIGVYYSPEFLALANKFEFVCHPNERSDIFFIFPIGAASSDLFDQIITSMFISVTRLHNLPQPSSKGSSIDGLLELQIESFKWEPVCSKDKALYHILAKIRYIVNLYDPGGHLISSLRITGSGFERPKACFTGCKDSYATEQAMQDAMANFMLKFCEQSEVKQWISTQSLLYGAHP